MEEILTSYGFTNPTNTEILIDVVSRVPMEVHELLESVFLQIYKTTLTNQDIDFLVSVILYNNMDLIKWSGSLILKLRELRYMLQECQKSGRIDTQTQQDLLDYYKNYFYTNYTNYPLEQTFMEIEEVKKEIKETCGKKTNIKKESLEDLKTSILEVASGCGGFEDEFVYYLGMLLDDIIKSRMQQEPKRERLVAILNGMKHLCNQAGDFDIAMDLKKSLLEYLSVSRGVVDIGDYFRKFTDLVVAEMLPLRDTGLEDIFRRLEEMEASKRGDRFIRELGDVDVGGSRRQIMTMKSLVPQRLPPRGREFPTRDLGGGGILRDREMPELVGHHRPMSGKEDRLLLNVDPKGSPTFTGFYHPYVVDKANRQLYECGMRCRRDRNPDENQSIMDSCIIQLQRRRKNNDGSPRDLKTLEFTQRNIDECRNIINRQRSRPKRPTDAPWKRSPKKMRRSYKKN